MQQSRAELGAIALALTLVVGMSAVLAYGANARDKATANRAVLRLSDFPSGWRTSSDSSSASGDQIAAEIRECKTFLGVTKKLKDQHVGSGTRHFAQGSNDTVSNSVSMYTTTAQAKAAVRAFGSSSVPTCLQKVLTAAIKKSESTGVTQLKSVDVGRLSVSPVGDRNIAYQANITLRLGKLTPTLTADYQLVQVGRAATLFAFVGVDSDLQSQLLEAVVARLQGGASPGGTPTTTTTPKGSALGTTLKTPSGNSLTVYSYEQPANGLNSFQHPQQAGDEFAAIDVQGCAATASASLNPFSFELAMSDNTRRQPTFGKEPALNATDLNPGDCVRGWVTFEVPAGQRPASVLFSTGGGTGSTILKWQVS